MTKKEEILLSTLDLASKYGLKSLSMSQIAESVGIRKPSLYNHFHSKDELIQEMYEYLRNKSKQGVPDIPLENIDALSAYDVLSGTVTNYKKLAMSEDMLKFYSVIYSERTTNAAAAQILVEETNKMIAATKELFGILKAKNKLCIDDVETAAIAFSLTVHSLIDFELDCQKSNQDFDKDNLRRYIKWFCDQYKKEDYEEQKAN